MDVRYTLSDKEANAPLLTYAQWVERKSHQERIAARMKLPNNVLANELRAGHRIIDCYKIPYTVDDPKQKRQRKYSAAVLACAKKQHLIYFLYQLAHRQGATDNRQKMVAPFIVLDGPDCSGKTTQVPRVVKYINSLGLFAGLVKQVKAPSGSIREYLLSDEGKDIDLVARVGLNMIAMSTCYQEDVLPNLRSNTPVVADRWVGSTYAFQGDGQGVSPNMIRGVERLFKPGVPDLVIVLLPSIEVAAARQALRKEQCNHLDQLDVETKARIHACYANKFKRHNPTFNTVIVDADGTEDEVYSRIERVLTTYFQENL